jgi:hypothetical protein
MNNDTPIPEDFEENHFPVRGNDWLINDAEEIAQVRAVYASKDYSDENQRLRFYVDLVFYDHSGRKIGRKSINPSLLIDGVMRRGPRAFDPFCDLEGWRRIEKPDFPLSRVAVDTPVHDKPGMVRLSYEWDVTPKKWGNYAKRKRVRVVAPVMPSRPNYDPELEKRVLLMTAQNLRDIARETGNEELRKRAQDLEAQADKMG